MEKATSPEITQLRSARQDHLSCTNFRGRRASAQRRAPPVFNNIFLS